jgi:single-strand DNA-binding protein
MANLNLAQVIGYLGDDCNRSNRGITTLSNGDIKYTFSIATSDKWKDKLTGEPRSNTEWHKIETILKSTTPQGAHKYLEDTLKKGFLTEVRGKMRSSKYQLEDGIDRVKHYIEVNRMAGGAIQCLERRGAVVNGTSDNQTDSKVELEDTIPF